MPPLSAELLIAHWVHPGCRDSSQSASIIDLSGRFPSDLAIADLSDLRSSGLRFGAAIPPLVSSESYAMLRLTLESGATTICLRNAIGSEDLQQLDQMISVLEAELDRALGSTSIIPNIGSARGLLAVSNMRGKSDRLAAITWSVQDLVMDLGVDVESALIAHAKYNFLIGAATLGIPAIDTVSPSGVDLDTFRAEGLNARSIGFSGKFAADSAQAAVLRTIFGG